MDKIFQEIKKAIEEEMRNAESGPPPGGGRSQAGGGQRAQEYADWLKQEQDRLRGGGSGQQSAPPEQLEQVEVQQPRSWSSGDDRPRDSSGRRLQQPQSRDSRSRRSDQPQGQGSQRQQHENRASERRQKQQQQQRTKQTPKRAEPRPQRHQRDAYELRTASAMSGQIKRLLRSPNGLRQAFLLREIISKPVSLRSKDDHLVI
ncbi:MAG: hypothetical protein EA415_02320 [Sphaerobacteraceae bacterium]|nr:MAG: hypothetical protein EA415_02320 [Sphaerobacteraceae bacterium]